LYWENVEKMCFLYLLDLKSLLPIHSSTKFIEFTMSRHLIAACFHSFTLYKTFHMCKTYPVASVPRLYNLFSCTCNTYAPSPCLHSAQVLFGVGIITFTLWISTGSTVLILQLLWRCNFSVYFLTMSFWVRIGEFATANCSG
jgi:hypothetical protein